MGLFTMIFITYFIGLHLYMYVRVWSCPLSQKGEKIPRTYMYDQVECQKQKLFQPIWHTTDWH